MISTTDSLSSLKSVSIGSGGTCLVVVLLRLDSTPNWSTKIFVKTLYFSMLCLKANLSKPTFISIECSMAFSGLLSD